MVVEEKVERAEVRVKGGWLVASQPPARSPSSHHVVRPAFAPSFSRGTKLIEEALQSLPAIRSVPWLWRSRCRRAYLTLCSCRSTRVRPVVSY